MKSHCVTDHPHYYYLISQKDVLRDVLRVAADKTKESEGQFRRGGENGGILERAGAEESCEYQMMVSSFAFVS